MTRTFFLSSDWVKVILETLKRWAYFPVAALISVTALKLSGESGVQLIVVGAVLYGLFMTVHLFVQLSNVGRKVTNDSTKKSSSRTGVNK